MSVLLYENGSRGIIEEFGALDRVPQGEGWIGFDLGWGIRHPWGSSAGCRFWRASVIIKIEFIEIMDPQEENVAANEESEVVICPEAIESLRLLDPEDDGELFRDLISVFLEEAPELIEQARQALDEGNAAELEKAAHSLKGSCGNFGAQRLAKIAFGLEKAGKKGDMEEATALFPRINAAFEEVRAALLVHTEG